MARKRTFSREGIAEAAFSSVRRNGPEGFTARAIAKAAGCSTQPIFTAFGSAAALREETRARALEVYRRYIDEGLRNEKPFFGSGLAYIRFAKEEAGLFRFLFMDERHDPFDGVTITDDEGKMTKVVSAATGLSGGEAREFYLASWIFVHGIAAMLATGTVDYPDDMIERLLHRFFLGVRGTFEEGEVVNESH